MLERMMDYYVYGIEGIGACNAVFGDNEFT